MIPASGCTTTRLPAAVKAPVIAARAPKPLAMRRIGGFCLAPRVEGAAAHMADAGRKRGCRGLARGLVAKISANPVMANTETPIASGAARQKKTAFSK